MIKEISLENYKCFEKKTDISIAPLTILCGTNSSGKSSIIKSILSLMQTTDNKNLDLKLILSGDIVDNGTFKDTVYNHKENKPFIIKHTFEIKKTEKISSSFVRLLRIYDYPTKLSKFIVSIKITVNKNNSNNDNEFNEFLENNYISSYELEVIPVDENNEKLKNDSIFISLRKKYGREGHFLSWKNVLGSYYSRNTCINYDDFDCLCSFTGLGISGIATVTKPRISIRSVLPNIIEISQIVTSQYRNIYFIAPLRQTPERAYIIKNNVYSVGYSGENTPIILAKIKNKKTKNEFPYMKTQSNEITYDELINYWLNYFEIGSYVLHNKKGTVSISIGQNNLADVGFGVGQILPIITQSVLMKSGDTLLIEQPEIHLHPKMALEMADFLIEQAKTSRNMIVETHSDHIINRIIYRIMENYELNKLVRIYFIHENEENNHICSLVEIDKCNGTKIEFKDFFTQYSDETRKIVDIGFKNMMEK